MTDNKQTVTEEVKPIHPGTENLVDLRTRTQEERKEIARLGGIESGRKKRLAKDMRESMKVLLDMVATTEKQREVLGEEVTKNLEGYEVTIADILNLRMMQEAEQGSAKHFELIRDTAGYKPSETVQLDANVLTAEDKSLLEKVAKRTGIDAKLD